MGSVMLSAFRSLLTTRCSQLSVSIRIQFISFFNQVRDDVEVILTKFYTEWRAAPVLVDSHHRQRSALSLPWSTARR
jgi:hypothetical protein